MAGAGKSHRRAMPASPERRRQALAERDLGAVPLGDALDDGEPEPAAGHAAARLLRAR